MKAHLLHLQKRLLTISFFILLLSLLPITSFGLLSRSTIVQADEGETERLNVDSKSLVRDDTYTLKVYRTNPEQKIFFKSSDTDVATVKKTDTKEAEVTGVSVGTATITVTIKEGFKVTATLKCEITVTPPALSVKFSENTIDVVVGDRYVLKRDLKPLSTAENPIFISSDPSVVSVSTKGVITAIAPGEVTISVSIANGVTDICKIIVSEASPVTGDKGSATS
ncbi:Ig-like domain-containing protein [Anaeromicropila populeti]|uniref:Ig-like domain (Group 2) n=1 Tax=Anaeromicropila populeti TaxID=37658 RepID=A0A1I6HQ41_9FIRM|nr:Ig-like domain-containing protein [Anaeromicropila populeti]SFR56572.1 Ig-like domain (group 2) [Anaeromicropila populeti]